MEAEISSLQAKALHDKQKVRYFWQNKVLEEQSRSSTMFEMHLANLS